MGQLVRISSRHTTKQTRTTQKYTGQALQRRNTQDSTCPVCFRIVPVCFALCLLDRQSCLLEQMHSLHSGKGVIKRVQTKFMCRKLRHQKHSYYFKTLSTPFVMLSANSKHMFSFSNPSKDKSFPTWAIKSFSTQV